MNILFNGDNLIVLKKLEDSHANIIDCILIDPPYNTDISHIEYQDHAFEGGWKEFMTKRLKIANNLLSAKGVMFIHIDENELHNLIDICTEIFGKANVKTIIWKKVNNFFDANRVLKPIKNIRRVHEYIVVVFKDINNAKLNKIMQPKIVDKKIIEEEKHLETILDFMGTTSSAKDELARLFGSRDIFSTPKPLKLTKELIRSATKPDSIVLDFFAGSGTVAHAVMDLNQEDNGCRTFILITNNENNICTKVTYPRLKKAIELFHYKSKFKYVEISKKDLS